MISEQKKRLPPYISYRTFQHFIDMMEQEGIPARIDRSYWGSKYSGSVGTQLVGALHFLGLLDNNNIPGTRLKELVNRRGSQRTDVLRQTTTDAYVFILGNDFDAQKATYDQIEELLHKNFQLTDDVARKCIKFFLSLAQEAGVKVSPFIQKKYRNAASSTITRKSSKKTSGRTNKNFAAPAQDDEVPKRAPSGELLNDLLAKFPALDPSWPDEVKLKWFDAFFEMLKRSVGTGNGNGNKL